MTASPRFDMANRSWKPGRGQGAPVLGPGGRGRAEREAPAPQQPRPGLDGDLSRLHRHPPGLPAHGDEELLAHEATASHQRGVGVHQLWEALDHAGMLDFFPGGNQIFTCVKPSLREN